MILYIYFTVINYLFSFNLNLSTFLQCCIVTVCTLVKLLVAANLKQLFHGVLITGIFKNLKPGLGLFEN